MIKKIKNYIVAVAMIMAAGAPAVATVSAYAATNGIQDALCQGVNTATGGTSGSGLSGSGGCNNTDTTSKVADIARFVINILSIIVGVVAVVMIIVGGFKYITSGGDSGKVGGAKNTIIYAIIGLILVALAQVIVNLVLSKSSDLAQ